jgi:hypothetical protein
MASQLIDRAIDKLQDCGLLKPEEDRLGLGRALVETLKVIESLYATTAGLRRAKAEASKSEDRSNELFKVAAMKSLYAENNSDLYTAVDCFVQFLGVCNSHTHRNLARVEIDRLKKQIDNESNASIPRLAG